MPRIFEARWHADREHPADLPMPVITGAAKYPGEPLCASEEVCRMQRLDALAIAEKCGSQRAVNLALLGALSKHLPWEQDVWHKAIAACVPTKNASNQ